MFLDNTIKRHLSKRTSTSPLVSFTKSISWRILGTADTIFISWLITGETKTAVSIGAIEVVTKMTLYYLHERVWERLIFKSKNP